MIVWSRLYFDLEPYLSERAADGASLLAFYHRQLREVAEEEYLRGDEKPKRHSSLASYFASQDLFDPEKKTPNIRKLSELPYQQTHGALWDDLYKTLTDFEFLEAKCTHVAVATSGKGQDARKIHGGVYALQEDYQRALENWQGGPGPGRAKTGTRYPIIVAAVDFGNGPVIRCPACVELIPLQDGWLGQEITCPREGCNGWMKVNPFIAGRSR